ncbi:MAG: hypothetical protein M0Q12_11965 [Synergistaceae bacterium]|jgi:hypothetical protein|nr:hypothetical protein [Synergistaceae bacterium]
MVNKGFIKLPRHIIEDSHYFSEPFTRTQAWIDLIILANYQDTTALVRGVKIVVKRGQVCRSITELAKRWKWSRNRVMRFTEGLVDAERVHVQKSPIVNVYTIRDYEEYQGNGAANEATNRSTSGTIDGATRNPLSTKDMDAITDPGGAVQRTNIRTGNRTPDGARLKNKRKKEEKNNIPPNPLFEGRTDYDKTDNSDKGQQELQTLDEDNSSFDRFWNLYDKKVGRAKCEKLFHNLSGNDRNKIFENLPAYIQATPDKQFRKNPEAYLNNRTWEDEIIPAGNIVCSKTPAQVLKVEVL